MGSSGKHRQVLFCWLLIISPAPVNTLKGSQTMATIKTLSAGVSPYQVAAAEPTVLVTTANGRPSTVAASTSVVVNGQAALNSLITTSQTGVFQGANVTINLEEQNFNTTNQVTSNTNYPSGNTGEIQYNSGANSFASDPYFTYTNSNVVTPGIRTNNYLYGNGAPFIGGGNAAIGNFVFSGDIMTISDANQVMSITGNGTGNIQVNSNGNTWTFNNVGNLILPSNSSSINYANGVPYGVNYSNSNVSSFMAAFGSNVVSTTGNITAGYFIGNGSQLTGVVSGYGNANVVANLAALGSNPVSTTGNITGGNLLFGAGIVSGTGNITGGNLSGTSITGTLTTGTQSAITSVGTLTNMSTSGNANVTGNVNSARVSATGNITAGNILTGGLISVAGNITAGNLDAVNLVINSIRSDDSSFVTVEDGVNVNGEISATGNITGGNIAAQSGNIIDLLALNVTTVNIFARDASGINLGANGFNNLVVLETDVLVQNVPLSVTGNITAGNLDATNLVINSIRSDDSTFVTIEDGLNVTSGLISSPESMLLSAGANTWTFGTDGRLTFPGTPRIDTGSNNFEVQAAENISLEANAVVNIYTDTSGNAYQWQFGDDGNLTVPGNIILPPGAVLTGTGASPAPSINGFDTINAITFSASGNITGNNLAATNLVINSITSDDSTFVTIEDGVNVNGEISATGNITGNYFIGNGSQLTSINAVTVDITDTNGLTTVYYPTFVENRTTAQIARADVDLTYRTDDNLLTVGNVSVTGNITANNGMFTTIVNTASFTGGLVSVTGNITGGNILSGGLISVTGNISAGNLDATNLVINSITSDDSTFVTIEDGVNVNGEISATGNITGNYFIGNGSQLTSVAVPSQTILPTIQSITAVARPAGLFGGGQGGANVTVANNIPVTEYGVIITAGTTSETYKTGALGSIPGTVALTFSTGLNSTQYTLFAYVTSNAGTYYSDAVTGTSGICLLAGTQIALSDGTHKAIEDITYTDKLLSWDFDRGCYAETTAMWIKRSETGSQYNLLTFSDGTTLRTFDQHRIFNKQAGAFTYPMTAATPVGTVTVNEHGQEISLTNKQVIRDTIEYYNVITNYHMNLFSDSVLTSCRFNNIYPIVDMKFVKDNRTLRTRAEFENVPDRFFHGLRLAEQIADIETVEWYVNRLLSTEVSTQPELAV